ncbi:MAG TPA: c-type cytochrome [Candidatus Acidoferrum sp.]|nr:c-type cytochrome [Candidatus Acidoferrum sp.]
MTIKPFVSLLFGMLAAVATAGHAQQTPLAWAYGVNTPDLNLTAPNGVQHVPGSQLTFNFPRDRFSPPDWHPADHPVMPPVVAQGRQPQVFACGYCHLPDGQGRPENASLVGLSADYIKQQLADYRAGLRKSSEPQMTPPALMQAIGLNASAEEAEQAAMYFAALKPRRWIRVVETATVPETVVTGWMYIAKAGGKSEPIGNRILEMPEDFARTELRDSHSGFVAYVPPGSIKRGQQLASGNDNRTRTCSLCHGSDLRGLGPVPRLAGRSPSYLARQLYDLQQGNRHGTWSPLMVEVVAKLTPDDITNLAAYLASLEP